MEIVVVATAAQYRRLALERTQTSDVVVEIGCSTGNTTELLSGRCRQVMAVDVSREMVERVQRRLEGRANVCVVCQDGREVGPLAEQAPEPDVVFIDIGGNALVENVATILWQVFRYLAPARLIIVRSERLARLTARISETESGATAVAGATRAVAAPLESLLELSYSSSASNRRFAARRLRDMPVPEAQQRLRELASDPNGQVRRVANLRHRVGE